VFYALLEYLNLFWH